MRRLILTLFCFLSFLVADHSNAQLIPNTFSEILFLNAYGDYPNTTFVSFWINDKITYVGLERKSSTSYIKILSGKAKIYAGTTFSDRVLLDFDFEKDHKYSVIALYAKNGTSLQLMVVKTSGFLPEISKAKIIFTNVSTMPVEATDDLGNRIFVTQDTPVQQVRSIGDIIYVGIKLESRIKVISEYLNKVVHIFFTENYSVSTVGVSIVDD